MSGGKIQIDTLEWDHHWEDVWGHVTEAVPEAKRLAMRNAALEMARVVWKQIGRRVNDSHGHVQRWQDPRVGSLGGYAAVSARKEAVGGSTLDSRRLTDVLEFGHGVLGPSGKAKRYVYRGSYRSYVPGRQFYSWAKSEIAESDLIVRAAEKVLLALENAFDL